MLIFTRNPELGKVKTRLAASIGDKAALAVYKELLLHTKTITETVKAVKAVYYSEAIEQNDIWVESVFGKNLQQGDDLGERMKNAFEEGFRQGFEQLVIIGSDVYDISTSDLEKAFEHLETSDYVIGPAEDGGYYLLGMKKLNHEIFRDKDWGTSTVYEQTLKDLEGPVAVLPRRNDIDRYEDIKQIEFFKPFLKLRG